MKAPFVLFKISSVTLNNKHIEIRHSFIRDSYEKTVDTNDKRFHTDHKFADLLIKAFDVADETVYKEWEDKMERAATTASSLDAEQDNDAQTRFETTFKKSYDPPLSRGYILGSGEDRTDKPKRKPKAKQNQARNGKDKVKGHPSEENIT
ncbi:hypothetical protein Tco_0122944 [Tanacetum coccineum]